LIGDFITPLNKLLTAHRQTVKGELTMPNGKGKERGRIIIKADSVEESNHETKMKISCTLVSKATKNFRNVFRCCRGIANNPILTIEREGEADDEMKNAYIRVFESENI